MLSDGMGNNDILPARPCARREPEAGWDLLVRRGFRDSHSTSDTALPPFQPPDSAVVAISSYSAGSNFVSGQRAR
jgi:hypothetical protein